jgi:hypothetical protein
MLFVTCVKKFGVKKIVDFIFFFVFYTSHRKCRFFRETCYTQIECQDVNVYFLFQISLTFLQYFPVVGAYAPMCQTKFMFYIFPTYGVDY